MKKARMTLSSCGLLFWGGKWDSNPRQPESQSGTLPTELFPPVFLFSQERVVLERFEFYRKFRVLQGVRVENTVNTVYGVARYCGTVNFVVL